MYKGRAKNKKFMPLNYHGAFFYNVQEQKVYLRNQYLNPAMQKPPGKISLDKDLKTMKRGGCTSKHQLDCLQVNSKLPTEPSSPFFILYHLMSSGCVSLHVSCCFVHSIQPAQVDSECPSISHDHDFILSDNDNSEEFCGGGCGNNDVSFVCR